MLSFPLTSADVGQIFHLMNPGVMLQQLHRDEVLVANAARESRLSYDFSCLEFCHQELSGDDNFTRETSRGDLISDKNEMIPLLTTPTLCVV